MELSGRHIVVTGGGGGIGGALSRRFAQEGARLVVVADRDLAKAETVASEIGAGALAVEFDASREDGVKALIATAQEAGGAIDIFVSNAGVPGGGGGPVETSDADWDEAWRVNVMAHVWASRALLPQMLARGEGYLINTASAAGLLTQVSSVGYSVTKHAAVALAEHLAIQYGDRGIRVSVLCPQSVQTGMTTPGPSAARVDGVMQPAEVARIVIEAMVAERFLILSHPSVHEYMQRKASGIDRWLAGMRRLRDRIYGAPRQV
jgi:NAD(P)-dependent dehydrogenase (short-subunit alcohol dehydrogenase family)